jgi:small subunit ribosomal protein S16
MATKIRLQRHGRKKRAFYHIVVADQRSPRDGRFIEKIGTYNPISNPATIILDVDKAVDWLLKGAQPTDTARAILSYKGAAYKKHLQVGVNKGAITQEVADQRFNEWLNEKESKVQAKRDGLSQAAADQRATALAAEIKRKEEYAAKLQAKLAEAEAAANPAEEETEVASEEVASEEAATEGADAPAEESAE